MTTYKTQIEADFQKNFTEEEWKALADMEAIAKDLTAHCLSSIRERVRSIPETPMRYRAQWTLEKLVGMLSAQI